jgi:formate hydrogenlyase transcriptional activator
MNHRRSGGSDVPSAALEGRFEELQTLYRTLPIGIGLVDRNLRFVRVNTQLAEYAGVPREEMLGRKTREIVPEIAPKTEPIYRRVLETGEPILDVEVTGPTQANPGSERHWLASYSPLLNEDAEIQGISLLVRDITQRKQAELRLEERLALVQIVAELATQFVDTHASDIPARIDGALRRIGEFFEADAARLGYVTLDGKILPTARAWFSGRFDPDRLAPIIFERTYPRLAKSLVERGLLVCNSVDDFAEWGGEAELEFVRKTGVKAAVIVSLGVNGGMIEVFAIEVMRSERSWSQDAVECAQLVGRILSNAARRASAEAITEQQARFDHLGAEIAAGLAAASGQQVAGVVREAMHRIGEFIGAERCGVYLFSEDKARFVDSHAWVDEGLTLPPTLQNEPPPEWHSFLRQILGDQALMANDVDDLPEEAEKQKEFLHQAGIKSLIVVPMLEADEVVGCLVLDTVGERRTWPDELAQGLRLLTSVINSTLARKGVDEELQHTLARSRESESRFRQLAENVPAIFTHVDRDLRYRFSNRKHQEAVGREPEEIVGRTVEEVLGEKSTTLLQPYLDRALAGETVQWEYELLAPTGRTAWFLGHAVPEVAEDGSVTGMFGLTADITEIKENEEKLRQALTENERLRERLKTENIYLRETARLTHGHQDIVGESEPMRKMLAAAERVAVTDSTVLILGETGTGKELLARWIHRLSSRKYRLMVEVNCAGLPATLVESELFGREKGAYTGALAHQKGRFEIADGSTIFLDEIGELPPELQTKLLRVLQEGRFERLGSPKPLKVDVRVIAATNRDLARSMAEGRFREDLFYRINVFPITVPPLRQRREDIPLLVWAFVEEIGKAMGKSIDSIPATDMEALQSYDWPGNVRELRNVIERALILSADGTLRFELPGPSDSPADEAISFEEAQRRHIVAALERCGWRVRGEGGAAEALELKPTTLEFKMKKLGVERPQRSSSPKE